MICSLRTVKLIYGDLKKQFSLVWKPSDLKVAGRRKKFMWSGWHDGCV